MRENDDAPGERTEGDDSTEDAPPAYVSVDGPSSESPFAAAAEYLALGYAPLPLPHGEKAPPPTGWTGYDGQWPTADDVAGWTRPDLQNIALRLPSDVIGLDVDAYDGKPGADTLADHEAWLGPLPPTWRTTSRADDAVSGIRFYRVPAGRRWANTVGCSECGIEVIHHGHRYAVAPPSLHPEGGEYGLFGPDGLPEFGFPSPGELPELPPAWVEEFDRGEVADRPTPLGAAESSAWLDGLPGGSPCTPVERVLKDAEAAFSSGETKRHVVARDHSLRLVRLGEQGHAGVPVALDTLESLFCAAVGPDRDAGGEWARMVQGAVAKACAAPTADADRGCCPDRGDDAAQDFALLDFFDETPVLRHVRAAAHSRGVKAPVVLASLLGYVLLQTEPDVVLPPVVGSTASLNLGFALVGDSGSSKTASSAVAVELLGLTPGDVRVLPVGSGEGMIDAFYQSVPKDADKPDGHKHLELVPEPLRQRMFLVDEGETLKKLADRSGTTLGGFLRTALTGGMLGTTNAKTGGRTRMVPANSYRLVMLADIHPDQADVLLGGGGVGMPQRFLWVRSADPSLAKDETDLPEWPGPLKFDSFLIPGGVLDYPAHIAKEVRQANLDREHGVVDTRLAHAMLTRLKVAQALAMLHNEPTITDQWWRLAGRLSDESLTVQDWCLDRLAANHQHQRNTVAKAEARAADAAADDRLDRCVRAVVEKLRKRPGETLSWRDAKPAARSTQGITTKEIVEALQGQAGMTVEVGKATNGKTSYRLRFDG